MSVPQDADPFILLHNPRCSKSRAVRALLEEAGVEFSERLYLDDPLDEGELEDLERRLGRPVTEWVRRGEQAFAEEGLTPDASTSTLRAAMARSPILMERPIVMRGERAVVGRPPEDVKTLF